MYLCATSLGQFVCWIVWVYLNQRYSIHVQTSTVCPEYAHIEIDQVTFCGMWSMICRLLQAIKKVKKGDPTPPWMSLAFMVMYPPTQTLPQPKWALENYGKLLSKAEMYRKCLISSWTFEVPRDCSARPQLRLHQLHPLRVEWLENIRFCLKVLTCPIRIGPQSNRTT